MFKVLFITLLVSKGAYSCGLDYLAYKVIDGVTGAYNYAVNGFKTSLNILKEIHHDVAGETILDKSTPYPYSEALIEYFNSRQNAENQNGMEGDILPPGVAENYNIANVQKMPLYKHRPPTVVARTTVKTPRPKPKKWEDWFISTTEHSRKDLYLLSRYPHITDPPTNIYKGKKIPKKNTDFAVPITDVPMRGNLYDKHVEPAIRGELVHPFAVPMRGNLYEKLAITSPQPRSYADLKKELEKPIKELLIKPNEMRFAQDQLRIQNVLNNLKPEDFIKYNVLKEAFGHIDKFPQIRIQNNRGYSIYGETTPEPTMDNNLYEYLSKISQYPGNYNHQKFLNYKKAAEELRMKNLNEIFIENEKEKELQNIKMNTEEGYRLPLYHVTVAAAKPRYEPNTMQLRRFRPDVSGSGRHYGPDARSSGHRWSENRMRHYLDMVRDGRLPRIQAAMRPLKLDTPPSQPMKNLLKMVKAPRYEIQPEKDIISSNPKHDDEKRKIGKALAKMEKMKKEKKAGITRKPNVIREMLKKELLLDEIPEPKKADKSSDQDEEYEKREYFKPKMLESYRRLVDLNML